MGIDNEKNEVADLIKDFINIKGELSLKEVSDEFDVYKKISIELFEKEIANYSLGNKKFIEKQIKDIEDNYNNIQDSTDEIMGMGFNAAVKNSSTKLKDIFIEVSFRGYCYYEDFSNLAVTHVSKLYNAPWQFLGKKIKDLNKVEVDYEIFTYLIWGINDCFYLKWLYEELANTDNRQNKFSDKKLNKGNDGKPNFESLFYENNNGFQICKDLFEYLEITIGGEPNMLDGRVGKLTGMITAIKKTPGLLKLDNPPDKQLLAYFNAYLGTKYKSFSKRNQQYEESLDSANSYIKMHFKK